MSGAVNLNADIFHRVRVSAAGGAYNRGQGETERTRRDLSPLLIEARISDTVHEAARRADFVFDHSHPDLLISTQLGSWFTMYAHTLNSSTGEASGDMQRVFRGLVFHDQKSDSANHNTRKYTCYDTLTYLPRSEDKLVWRDLTLSEIVTSIATIASIPVGTITPTTTDVGQIIMGPGRSYWDVIQEAIARTKEETGVEYFCRINDLLLDTEGREGIDLLPLAETGTTWTIRDGKDGSLVDMEFSEDVGDEFGTQVEAVVEVYDDGAEAPRVGYSYLAEWFDSTDADSERPDWRQTLGLIPKRIAPDNAMGDDGVIDTAAVQARAEEILEQIAKPDRSATATSLKIPGIRRGDEVVIESRSGTSLVEAHFYCQSVVSVWSENDMSQSIELAWNEGN